MKRGRTGRYEVSSIGGEKVRAFIPAKNGLCLRYKAFAKELAFLSRPHPKE
ncbi:MAG: hypothetical protein J7L26_05115 [Candidatus Aminicenantes bacterium]|nr:hypothetical protein [Candidatus Aminicenantes bacterium]